MYLDHFSLRQYPFRLTPDSDFLYMSQGHARAKAYMDYAVVSRDGFVVITGEIGAGKTTLLNKLVGDLPDDVIVVFVDQTQLNEFEFLQAIMAELGFPRVEAGKVELVNRLRDHLAQKYREGLHLVLIVDEAQSLGYKVLEEIRFLSGLEANRDKLVSVILAGQPELGRVLESSEMAQLLQRVRLRFHLDALTPDETRAYIMHRLAIAGTSRDDIFTEDVYPVIDTYTGGIPRLINSLCDMALLTAYVDGRDTVAGETMETAVHELGWAPYSDRARGGNGVRGAHAATASEIAFCETDRLLFQELNGHVGELVRLLSDSMTEMREDMKAFQTRLDALEDNLTSKPKTPASRSGR